MKFQPFFLAEQDFRICVAVWSRLKSSFSLFVILSVNDTKIQKKKKNTTKKILKYNILCLFCNVSDTLFDQNLPALLVSVTNGVYKKTDRKTNIAAYGVNQLRGLFSGKKTSLIRQA